VEISIIAVTRNVLGSTLAFGGSGRRSIMDAIKVIFCDGNAEHGAIYSPFVQWRSQPKIFGGQNV